MVNLTSDLLLSVYLKALGLNSKLVLHIKRMDKLKDLQNKARYTATEIACGWAGAIFEVTRPFGQEHWGQRNKIIKKVKCDRPTNRPTGGQSGLLSHVHATKKKTEKKYSLDLLTIVRGTQINSSHNFFRKAIPLNKSSKYCTWSAVTDALLGVIQ